MVLTLKTVNQFFLHDILSHDHTSPYQFWLKMVEWFRNYHLDKTGHTDRLTHGQTDKLILIYSPPPPLGEYKTQMKKKKANSQASCNENTYSFFQTFMLLWKWFNFKDNKPGLKVKSLTEVNITHSFKDLTWIASEKMQTLRFVLMQEMHYCFSWVDYTLKLFKALSLMIVSIIISNN